MFCNMLAPIVVYCVIYFVGYCTKDNGENMYNLTTFNTYQIAIAPNKVETRQAQFELIREKYADITDVFCLNELFYPDDIQKYEDEFNDIYPHSYSELEEWSEDELILPQISCPTQLITALDTIRRKMPQMIECFDECQIDFIHEFQGSLKFTNCVIAHCLIPNIIQVTDSSSESDESFNLLDALRQLQRSRCLHCLGVSLLEANELDLNYFTILEQCLLPLDYNYKPTSGLLILSKYPLSNKRMITMPSSFDFPRSMIMADIHIDDALDKTLTIGCIHPQAPYPNKTRKDALFPYVGFDQIIMDLKLSTFTELTALQMMLIGQHIKRKNRMQDFVLMGDYNVGHNFEEEIYHEFMDYTMMRNIFTDEEMEEIHCTWCHDNYFNDNVDEEEQLIDHIVYQSIYHVVEAKAKGRCFEEEWKYDVNGDTVHRHISDHYGICSSIQFFAPV